MHLEVVNEAGAANFTQWLSVALAGLFDTPPFHLVPSKINMSYMFVVFLVLGCLLLVSFCMRLSGMPKAPNKPLVSTTSPVPIDIIRNYAVCALNQSISHSKCSQQFHQVGSTANAPFLVLGGRLASHSSPNIPTYTVDYRSDHPPPIHIVFTALFTLPGMVSHKLFYLCTSISNSFLKLFANRFCQTLGNYVRYGLSYCVCNCPANDDDEEVVCSLSMSSYSPQLTLTQEANEEELALALSLQAHLDGKAKNRGSSHHSTVLSPNRPSLTSTPCINTPTLPPSLKPDIAVRLPWVPVADDSAKTLTTAGSCLKALTRRESVRVTSLFLQSAYTKQRSTRGDARIASDSHNNNTSLDHTTFACRTSTMGATYISNPTRGRIRPLVTMDTSLMKYLPTITTIVEPFQPTTLTSSHKPGLTLSTPRHPSPLYCNTGNNTNNVSPMDQHDHTVLGVGDGDHITSSFNRCSDSSINSTTSLHNDETEGAVRFGWCWPTTPEDHAIEPLNVTIPDISISLPSTSTPSVNGCFYMPQADKDVTVPLSDATTTEPCGPPLSPLSTSSVSSISALSTSSDPKSSTSLSSFATSSFYPSPRPSTIGASNLTTSPFITTRSALPVKRGPPLSQRNVRLAPILWKLARDLEKCQGSLGNNNCTPSSSKSAITDTPHVSNRGPGSAQFASALSMSSHHRTHTVLSALLSYDPDADPSLLTELLASTSTLSTLSSRSPTSVPSKSAWSTFLAAVVSVLSPLSSLTATSSVTSITSSTSAEEVSPAASADSETTAWSSSHSSMTSNLPPQTYSSLSSLSQTSLTSTLDNDELYTTMNHELTEMLDSFKTSFTPTHFLNVRNALYAGSDALTLFSSAAAAAASVADTAWSERWESVEKKQPG